MSERLYFRRWLAGRDFARDDDLAGPMRNFVYALGDRESGEAVIVDPAYRPGELIDLLAADGLELAGVLGTHYHPDHIGGDLMGHRVAGVAELLALADVPVHIQRDEVEWVVKRTGVSRDHLVAHVPGDRVSVGDIPIELIHTPGHTPGSQCLLVEGRLISGDTLFIDGCGRTDLPGADPEEMYRSLTQRLSAVSDDTVLCPGHDYSAEPSALLGEVRRTNAVLAPASAQQWLAMFAR